MLLILLYWGKSWPRTLVPTKLKFESTIQNLLATCVHWASVLFSVNCDNTCLIARLREFNALRCVRALVRLSAECLVNGTLPPFDPIDMAGKHQFPRMASPFTGCPPCVKGVWWTKARFLPWRRPELIWLHLCLYRSCQGSSMHQETSFQAL